MANVLGKTCLALKSISKRDRMYKDYLNETKKIIIPAKDRQSIINRIPKLRALNVHEAIEIETILDEVRAETSDDSQAWVESVLDAAYAGNQEHYFDLLDQVTVKE